MLLNAIVLYHTPQAKMRLRLFTRRLQDLSEHRGWHRLQVRVQGRLDVRREAGI
jgi:hypothetical protein